MPELYESDRLYCTTCKEQPEFFLETIALQVNLVNRNGCKYATTKHGDVEYECSRCGKAASWGHEPNP